MYDSLSDNAASYRSTVYVAEKLCRRQGRITVTEIHQQLPNYSHSTILAAVGRAVANGLFVRTGPFTIAIPKADNQTAKTAAKKITKKKTAAKKATKKPAIEKKPMPTTITIIDRITRIERMLGV